MHDHMFPIGTLEGADRRHQRAAGAGAVAWTLLVYVARVETERAVIALMSATGKRNDEALAVAAAEALVRLVAPAAQRVTGGRLIERHMRAARCRPPTGVSAYTLVFWLFRLGFAPVLTVWTARRGVSAQTLRVCGEHPQIA